MKVSNQPHCRTARKTFHFPLDWLHSRSGWRSKEKNWCRARESPPPILSESFLSKVSFKTPNSTQYTHLSLWVTLRNIATKTLLSGTRQIALWVRKVHEHISRHTRNGVHTSRYLLPIEHACILIKLLQGIRERCQWNPGVQVTCACVLCIKHITPQPNG